MTEVLEINPEEQKLRERARAEWGSFKPYSYKPNFEIHNPYFRIKFFNNLPTKFPMDYEKEYPLLALGMEASKNQKPLRTPAKEKIHSELYFSYPIKRVYETTELVIERVGLIERAEAARKEYLLLSDESPVEEIIEVLEVFYLIYEEMAAEGYTYDDIVG